MSQNMIFYYKFTPQIRTLLYTCRALYQVPKVSILEEFYSTCKKKYNLHALLYRQIADYGYLQIGVLHSSSHIQLSIL